MSIKLIPTAWRSGRIRPCLAPQPLGFSFFLPFSPCLGLIFQTCQASPHLPAFLFTVPSTRNVLLLPPPSTHPEQDGTFSSFTYQFSHPQTLHYLRDLY